MISRFFLLLAFIAFISTVGGFIVLAVWDVPIEQEVVEKPLAEISSAKPNQ